MQPTKFIWFNGEFVPWQEAKVHVLVHTLHYGSGVFEGIRMYNTSRGSAIFQLDRHLDRLFYSASALRMEVNYSQKEFKQAVLDTVKKNNVDSCYIRPIIFYGYEELKVVPNGCPVDSAIALWPWGSYLGDETASVKVSDYIRLHPRSSVADAKITGHYANSMLAGLQATEAGYTEALLLDYEGNIAEGPGENFFIVKDETVITPPLGTILAGITRESVIKVARDLGMEVSEQNITLDEAYEADECFFTGTAAEVTPIKSINDKQIKHEIGPVTRRLKDEFSKIVKGENKKYHKWLTFV